MTHSQDLDMTRVALLLLGTGAAGILVTSACYVVAGPVAALPGGTVDFEAARIATAQVGGWMRAAGIAGLPSDALFAVGAAMMGSLRRGPDAGMAVAGWWGMALAGALFVLVDAMVGWVLPAAAGHGAAAYSAVRALFDALFVIGGWTGGIGALGIAWTCRGPEFHGSGSLRWTTRAGGMLGLLANSAWLLGWPLPQLTGLAIGVGTAAMLALSVRGLRATRGAAVPRAN